MLSVIIVAIWIIAASTSMVLLAAALVIALHG